MKNFVVLIFKKIHLYYPLVNWKTRRRWATELVEWKKKGKPIPPPHLIKQKALREYSKKYGTKIFVETGTYLGDMVYAMAKNFDQIYSIELGKELSEKSTMRFKGIKKIEIIQGDSGSEIKGILNKINQPVLFWLDGHYSAGKTARGAKDTPILEELHHILASKDLGHVILIDDARCFGEDPGYPSIEELSKFVKLERPNVDIVVQDDSIRITPQQ
jgi:hypothetical protein